MNAASAKTAPDLEVDNLLSPPKEALALVILWSAAQPERVGETALLFPPHKHWILGRAPDSEITSPHDPQLPVHFARRRPLGSPDPDSAEGPPNSLLGDAISRKQLELVERGDSLLLRNIGRCQLSVNGRVVQSGTISAGDTLYLRGQLLLYCTRRPYAQRELFAYPAARLGAFGQPDADGLIGETPVMWTLRERLAACARTSCHVLVVGESGSGKELAAQAIHNLSRRSGRALIADNIAAIPPGLAAALLFGNKKNFPNPGMEERVGLIGSANGSTLFLDEIGDMPAAVQPLFLRVAERKGEYFRLGEDNKIHRSDFRLVGATNRPEKMRYELKRRFEREIRVPSLNARKEDIPLLIRHLLAIHAEKDEVDVQRFLRNGTPQVHPLFIEQLIHHEYTTNVSEVLFLIGHAMAESSGEVICPIRGGLPTQSRSKLQPRSSATAPEVSQVRRPLPPPPQAQRVLDEQGGHVARAASALGISRDQLNRMIRREHLKVTRSQNRSQGDPVNH